jgi:antitoxin MazE6
VSNTASNSCGPSTLLAQTAAFRAPVCYTQGMKTALSIPDEVFDGAERLARRTKKSLSRLFSDALKEYLERYAPEEATEAVNRACAEAGDLTDTFVSSAAP